MNNLTRRDAFKLAVSSLLGFFGFSQAKLPRYCVTENGVPYRLVDGPELAKQITGSIVAREIYIARLERDTAAKILEHVYGFTSKRAKLITRKR